MKTVEEHGTMWPEQEVVEKWWREHSMELKKALTQLRYEAALVVTVEEIERKIDSWYCGQDLHLRFNREGLARAVHTLKLRQPDVITVAGIEAVLSDVLSYRPENDAQAAELQGWATAVHALLRPRLEVDNEG